MPPLSCLVLMAFGFIPSLPRTRPMTLPEMIMEIKYLAREGVPKAQIARQCGVSRQTVYNLLERKRLAPHPRFLRASKLDPFKSYVRKFDLPAPPCGVSWKPRATAAGSPFCGNS